MSGASLKSKLERLAVLAALVLIAVAVVLTSLWHWRPALAEIDLPAWPDRPVTPGRVTVTWLGVSTLVFDDGDTQVLIDGFMTRPGLFALLTGRPIESRAVDVNEVLNRYGLYRIAAIVPTHTHFDHALDVAAIANRSGAVVFGSPSSAQIARGAGVPEEQISIVTDTATRQFGEFRVTLKPTQHSPFGWGGSVPLAGEIEEPITGPAPASRWRSGRSFSVIIAHPQGTTVVQSSSGFVENSLSDVDADVVMLGTAMLDGLGRSYAQRYWLSLVTATGANTVIPIHFDDYTQPFGTVELFPAFIDDLRVTAGWFREFQRFWDADVKIYLPTLGEAFVLYPEESPEA